MHRVHDHIVRQGTQVSNVIRGLLREFGHMNGRGPVAAMRLVKACRSGEFPDIPELEQSTPKTLRNQVSSPDERVVFCDKLIDHHSKIDEPAPRL